jgi:TolB-like protein
MNPLYRFDEFELDPVAFTLTRAGHRVALEPKAFDLLQYLVERPNRIVTKRELLDAIWKDVAVTENVLARAILLVRKALADDARVAKYVQTIPTRGYRFAAHPVRTVDGEREIRLASGHGTSDQRDSDPITIAVLPFVNVGGDAGTEHFSDGVSEDILDALARDSSLRVAARSSSFAFRGGGVDVRTIAAQLRVAFVLDGSVRRAEDRVRITAQLVDAATGFQLWSHRFDRDLTDIFAVQDEIAIAVAAATQEALQKTRGNLALPVATSTPVHRRMPPRNLDAYDVFLKGRYLTHQKFVVMGEARDCFRRAIALDPTFAPAYAALAENYGVCAVYAGLPPTEAFLAMRRFADEAKARAPELAEPDYLLAQVSLWFEWNVPACDRYLRRALAIEPNHTGALMFSAVVSAMCRQPEQAWRAVDRALRVDPLGQETRTSLLAVAWTTGEFERQIEEATRLIAEHPGYGEAFRWRSMAYTVRGEYDRARADLETFGALTNTHLYALNGLGIVAALEGKTAEARRILGVMMERSKREWVFPSAFGQVEQQLGNYETALDWYDRAYQTRDFLLAVLHCDPQFRLVPPGRTHPITQHPRWTALLQRIGVAPEYLAVAGASWRPECNRSEQRG